MKHHLFPSPSGLRKYSLLENYLWLLEFQHQGNGILGVVQRRCKLFLALLTPALGSHLLASFLILVV